MKNVIYHRLPHMNSCVNNVLLRNQNHSSYFNLLGNDKQNRMSNSVKLAKIEWEIFLGESLHSQWTYEDLYNADLSTNRWYLRSSVMARGLRWITEQALRSFCRYLPITGLSSSEVMYFSWAQSTTENTTSWNLKQVGGKYLAFSYIVSCTCTAVWLQAFKTLHYFCTTYTMFNVQKIQSGL